MRNKIKLLNIHKKLVFAVIIYSLVSCFFSIQRSNDPLSTENDQEEVVVGLNNSSLSASNNTTVLEHIQKVEEVSG